MKLFEVVVELRGNREITINGRQLQYLKDHDMLLEEKILGKNVSLDQQWAVLCEMRKLVAKLEFVYKKSRIRAGEVTNPTLITSGAKGINGTIIKSLPVGR